MVHIAPQYKALRSHMSVISSQMIDLEMLQWQKLCPHYLFF